MQALDLIICAMTAASLAVAADAAKGKEIFYQCSYCHNSETDAVKTGPSLKGLFSRAALVNGKPVDEANVRNLIEEGGGNGMPGYKNVMSEAAREALIAYLKSL